LHPLRLVVGVCLRLPTLLLLPFSCSVASFALLHKVAHDKNHGEVAGVRHRVAIVVHSATDKLLSFLASATAEPLFLRVGLANAYLVEVVRGDVVDVRVVGLVLIRLC